MSFYGIRYDRISDLVNIGAGQSCVVDVHVVVVHRTSINVNLHG